MPAAMTDEEIVRWWECERKLQRFATFTEANDHAWEIERAQVTSWHAVHAYQCNHCDGFHIGRAQLGRRRGWGRRLEHARHAEANHDTGEPGWRRRHSGSAVGNVSCETVTAERALDRHSR